MTAKDLLEGKRILLVDDEPDVLDTLADLLPTCDTVKASSFEAARDYLETEYFNLAILDIMGVEGYRLLDIANQRRVTSVMLTAHALSPENIVKSFREGAAYYLPKEEMVNIASFLSDVLEALEQSKSTWRSWNDRMGAFFEKKFGSQWQDDEKEFWERFLFYKTVLQSLIWLICQFDHCEPKYCCNLHAPHRAHPANQYGHRYARHIEHRKNHRRA